MNVYYKGDIIATNLSFDVASRWIAAVVAESEGYIFHDFQIREG